MHGVGLMRWGFGLFCSAFLKSGLVGWVERCVGYGVARGSRAARNAGERELPRADADFPRICAVQSARFEQGHAWMHEVCGAGLPGDSPYRAAPPAAFGAEVVCLIFF